MRLVPQQPSRRGFLGRTLGPSLAGASLLDLAILRAARARAQSRQALPVLYDIEKIAAGVFAAIARPAVIPNSNMAIFEDRADVLLVDAPSTPFAAACLFAQLRREVTDKPVRWLVSTHFHGDVNQGIAGLRRIAPRADLVTSETARSLLASSGAARLKAAVDQAQGAVQSHREKAAAAKAAQEKAYWQRMAQETRDFIGEMRDCPIELANLTFQRELRIAGKDHTLYLSTHGRGHTAGDIVVWCPEKQVAATGGLLHGFPPDFRDAYPAEWPRTLRQAGKLSFNRVIGAHGAVQQGKQRLEQTAAYIEELFNVVSAGKRKGQSLAAIQSSWTPGRLKSLAQGGYGAYISGSLARYSLNPPGTGAAQLLAEALRSNIAQMDTAIGRKLVVNR